MMALGLAACGPVPGNSVVNSTGDAADQSADGTCRTSGGVCTLRAALQEANRVSGHNTITFSISGGTTARTIIPASQLPTLSDPAGVTINGYSQSESSVNTSATASNAKILIQLQGPGMTSGREGLYITSSNNVVRGLAIWNFQRQVRLYGTGAHDNEIIGNFLGTNAAATVGAGSYTGGSMGVHIQEGANHNRIGEPGAANRNVISGNGQHGVATYNDMTDFNVIQNNIIGLKPDGVGRLANQSHGIDLNTYTADTLIGGTGAGERNVVSGNAQNGIEISHGSGTLRNDVIGNLIGTTATGGSVSTNTRNGHFGIDLQGVGNPAVDCGTTCPADAGESTVTGGNVIVNNGFGGMLMTSGDHDNVVTNNFIGVLGNGTTSAPNGLRGIALEKGTFGNRIGPGNIIANNPVGIVLRPDSTDPASSGQVPTDRNTFTQNSIRNNTGLGIDLYPLNAVTLNPPAKVNNSVDIPTNTAKTSTAVTYSTCGGCTIEVFIADVTTVGAYGEGKTYVASATADPTTGTAVVPLPDSAKGKVVTATATDTTRSTSEFSANVQVPSLP